VKNFCNEEFVIWICSPDIVRMIKYRMKMWQEPAACTGNMRNSGDILVTKSEENRPLKKHRNLKIYFQGRDKNCLGLGPMVSYLRDMNINLQIPTEAVNFLTHKGIISFSRTTLLHCFISLISSLVLC